MFNFMRWSGRLIKLYVKISDRWTRGPLIWILLWPFYLMFVAMNQESGVSAMMAFIPLIPLAFILLISPTLSGVAWNTDEGKVAIRVLCTIVGTELLIGLYFVLIPIENEIKLVPIFLLTALTLILFTVAGYETPAYAEMVKPILLGLLGIYTVWFYIQPYWTQSTNNPVPLWGFLLILGIVGMAAWNGLQGWQRYAAIAALVVVMFAGWQKLYAGKKLITLPTASAATTPGYTVGMPGSPKVFQPDSIIVPTTREWSESTNSPLGLRIRWMPSKACAYEVKDANSVITHFPAIAEDTIRLKGPHHRVQFRSVDKSAGCDSMRITVYRSAL